ncbi:MAG: FoF1 ATP synthase subunit delta/epsilon [Bacteriovoracia bacterium]
MFFGLNLFTPRRNILLDEEVTSLIIPTTKGVANILTGHDQRILVLVPGVVTLYCVDGTEKYFFIDTGTCRIFKDQIVILTRNCTCDNDIDLDQLEVQYAKLQQQINATIQGITTETELNILYKRQYVLEHELTVARLSRQ